jgi:heat shock protein HslJ/uncharacterized membrane protein
MIKLSSMTVAFLLGATIAAQASDFVARGNEPGWILRKTAEEIEFRPMEGPTLNISPVPTARRTEDGEVYETIRDGRPFRLTIASKVCVDTMSGMNYPMSAEVLIGTDTLLGCGGDPFTLLKGEWAVERLGEEPVIDGSQVTLNFEDGGKLNGGASCNRYIGSFELTGEGLTVSEAGATMMMCEQPLMDQERRFLEMLSATTGFKIDSDGRLILQAGDEASITASRMVGEQK